MTELTCFSWAVLCFYCINIMLFIVLLGQVGNQHVWGYTFPSKCPPKIKITQQVFPWQPNIPFFIKHMEFFKTLRRDGLFWIGWIYTMHLAKNDVIKIA